MIPLSPYSDGSCGPNGEYRRQSFVVSLWPYLDATNLYDLYNFNYCFYAPTNAVPVGATLSVYYCPSDRQGRYTADTWPSRCRGNYVTNWGYCDFTQSEPEPDGINPMKIGPFGPNRQSRAADVKDGLSNTLFLSEIIQTLNDSDWDLRGDFFNDTNGAAEFMSRYTPNSGIDMMPACASATDPGPCQAVGWGPRRCTFPPAASIPAA